MLRLIRSVSATSAKIKRNFSSDFQVYVLQNMYATKPSIRNQVKTENFKLYEDLGKVKKFVFREQQANETGLGPIPTVEEEAKFGEYQNPEYYSYHNYSYYDFELGIQCMHLPQPCAVGENDLLTMVRKTCIGEAEDHSGRCCPPPRCSVECMKESNSDDIDGRESKPKSEAGNDTCEQSAKDSSDGKCPANEDEAQQSLEEKDSDKNSNPVNGNQDTEKDSSGACEKTNK